MNYNFAQRITASDAEWDKSVKLGNKNVENLIKALNANGFKVGATHGDEEYNLTKKPEKVTPELMKKVLKQSGWKAQGANLFPNRDGEYYFEAPTMDHPSRETYSQAAYTVGDDHILIAPIGNW